MRILLIGRGRVGSSYAQVLNERGHEVRLVSSQEALPSDEKAIDCIALCVRDQAIPSMVIRLKESELITSRTTVLHCSATTPLEVLHPLAESGCGIVQTHPLVIFPEAIRPLQRDELEGMYLLVSGNEAGLKGAQRFAEALGMISYETSKNNLMAYHMALTLLLCAETETLLALGWELIERHEIPKVLQGAIRNLLAHKVQKNILIPMSSIRRVNPALLRAQLELVSGAGNGIHEFLLLCKKHIQYVYVSGLISTHDRSSLEEIIYSFERQCSLRRPSAELPWCVRRGAYEYGGEDEAGS